MKRIFIVILTFCLMNCQRSTDGPLVPIKLAGINGPALYAKDSRSGEMIRVYKEEYITSPQYQFTSESAGEFDFKGIISYDSTIVPFIYKFIVTKE